MATPIPSNAAPLTVWGAAAATGGRVVRGGDEAAIGISSDSRAVRPGCAFVALRGDRHDGHDYLDGAVAAGASLLVVERGRRVPLEAAGVVEVDDTTVAWGDLARAHLRAWRRERPQARIVAITGSAGKTTTKELCAALLRSLGECHATAGNLNNRVGVPAVAFGLGARHGSAVFEVGMNQRGEIGALAAIIEPDVAVITNVGVAHAQGVGGTRGDVAREKGDLFASLSPEAVAVTCFDDAAAMAQLQRTRARRAVTFGTGAGADYRLASRARNGLDGLDGAEVRIIRRRDDGEVALRLPVLGEAAALDMAAALAAVEAIAGPLSAVSIAEALRSLRLPPGRMHPRSLRSGVTVLDDTYNANPQSVRAALRTLAELTNGAAGRRGVVILGEMGELGAIAADEHDALGAAIAGSGARVALSCGGLADLSVAAAARGGVAAVRASDVREAAALATTLVAAGDVVLVKASRSIGAERVVDALVQAGGGEVATPEADR
jgi:UDP-N-acetylmuramoyl-tripeptide--D-alanyl-D-alanine ligase